MSPKEIAEMIIKKDLSLDNVHSNYIIIARAYLELLSENEFTEKVYRMNRKYVEDKKAEITKLKEENEKLKKSSEVLSGALEFYEAGTEYSMLGYTAREALKAYNEIMEGK